MAERRVCVGGAIGVRLLIGAPWGAVMKETSKGEMGKRFLESISSKRGLHTKWGPRWQRS